MLYSSSLLQEPSQDFPDTHDRQEPPNSILSKHPITITPSTNFLTLALPTCLAAFSIAAPVAQQVDAPQPAAPGAPALAAPGAAAPPGANSDPQSPQDEPAPAADTNNDGIPDYELPPQEAGGPRQTYRGTRRTLRRAQHSLHQTSMFSLHSTAFSLYFMWVGRSLLTFLGLRSHPLCLINLALLCLIKDKEGLYQIIWRRIKLLNPLGCRRGEVEFFFALSLAVQRVCEIEERKPLGIERAF